MNYPTARDLSVMLGGEVYQVDDETWLVLFERPDGRVVALSETSVDEYPDRDALASGQCYATISLA